MASPALSPETPGFVARIKSAIAAKVSSRAPAQEKPSDLEEYRLLVASLFSSPTSIVVSNIVGAAVPLFCWMATGMWLFLAVGLIAAATIVLRFMTVRRYVSIDHSAETFADTRRWDREYFLGATAYSTLLGLNCFAALVFTQNTAAHMITVVSAIAFSSGYVARNAGRPNFVIIQLMCFCLPMAAGLFGSGQPYFAGIGVFILLYILTNVAIVFSINRNLLALADATKRSRSLAETTRRQNLMLDSALNSMTHGLLMFDSDMRLEVQNSRHAELYGLAREAVHTGATLQDAVGALVSAGTISEESAGLLAQISERCLSLAEPGHLEFTTLHHKAFVVAVEPTADGGILITTEDATARRQIAAQFERMARYDGLTGLANRFTLNRALDSACAQGISDGHPAVLYIDVDNFKTVNDSLGHEWGDKLLVKIAEKLRALAGPKDTIARFGGDEFIWLHFADTAEDAVSAGKRAVESIASPFEIEGTTIYVTTSVGVALIPEHGKTSVDILRVADIALYAAKQAGRNTASVFAPSMEDKLRERRELENELRNACQSRSLTLHYQPIIDLRTGRVASCEALMRWNHPTRGMVSPGEFIPVAEQTGLISEMGDWAIEQACLDAATWPGDISVAVNISAFQFKDPARLIRAVKHALKLSRLPPNRLELEVTESLLIEDQATTLRTIQAIRRLGVKFSLDDFGVGYSSLAYLAQYPFSKVKIDRSFAKDITTSGPARSIVETVCRLARDLGLVVVVEGIETEPQQREAEKLGIEFAQGYLFGKPAASEIHISRITKAA